jgi:ankyrin repeat protein
MCGTLELPESNPLFALLHSKKWERAAKEARKSPSFAKQSYKVPGFYDNQVAPRVNALQLACALKAPPEVIEVLGSVNPAACSEVDSRYQRRALHVAVMNGASPKTVNALLKLDPKSAGVGDIHGRLALHYACKDSMNGVENVRQLLKVFPEAAQVADHNGFIPLHVACRRGESIPMIRILIRAAPNSIFTKTKKGSTPLSCARQVKGGAREELVGMLERLAEEAVLNIEVKSRRGSGWGKMVDGFSSTSFTKSVSCTGSVSSYSIESR